MTDIVVLSYAQDTSNIQHIILKIYQISFQSCDLNKASYGLRKKALTKDDLPGFTLLK